MKYAFSILVGILLSFLFLFKKDKQTEKKRTEEYPSDWFYAQRAYPYDYIKPEIYRQVLNQAQLLREKPTQTRSLNAWQLAGPVNIGGRIPSIAVHPAEPETIYIGAAAGGIFKTTDNGLTWKSIFDSQPALAIGDVEIAPSNRQVVYAGTGEPNGGGGSVNYEGLGIFKSRDGGITWQKAGLENTGSIGRIAIDPNNANRVFVAAMGYLYQKSSDRGIYRTLDGGASWKKVLYVTDSTGGIDLTIHPTNPDTIYVALWERSRTVQTRNYGGPSGGIFRSTDGGDTWTELTNGLPPDDFGRIAVSVSPKDPSIVYALMTNTVGFYKGIYRSTDNGNTWTKMDPNNKLSGIFSSYGWWMCRIIADPNNANRIYALGLDIFRSDDGGVNWQPVSSGVHVDQHALWINPADSRNILAANDGGLYSTTDDARTWRHFTNLPITQFYTCEIDENYPAKLLGGTQDNGTPATSTGRLDDWQVIYGGDGFVCLVDPTDSRYVYAEFQFGNIARSTDGGKTFKAAITGINNSELRNWNTPIVFSPDNPSILYTGTTKLYRSTDRAVTWKPFSPNLNNDTYGTNGVNYSTISTISVSSKNPDIIYVGTDDANVWITTDGGTNWKKINTGLPNRVITKVAADPYDANIAYVTVSGFRWREYIPHVFKTTNQGATWQAISGNLPEAPVNDIIVDPLIRNTLYIATDVGVYTSTTDGKTWQPLGADLPLVPVLDIRLHNPSRKLIAATFGRSMYTYDLKPLTSAEDIDNQSFSLKITPSILTKSSTIEITSTTTRHVHLDVFDATGRHIKTLKNRLLTEGVHSFYLNRYELPNAGIYMVRMVVNGRVKSAKFVVL
jgi:photosystem II stability/assembly factor-like uncharacterized protein